MLESALTRTGCSPEITVTFKILCPSVQAVHTVLNRFDIPSKQRGTALPRHELDSYPLGDGEAYSIQTWTRSRRVWHSKRLIYMRDPEFMNSCFILQSLCHAAYVLSSQDPLNLT